MGIMDIFKDTGPSIDEYASQAENLGATVIDVRQPNEFERGHIPGAINMPLDKLQAQSNRIRDKNALLYVYCLSGNRSARACKLLESLGFSNAINIGGINRYRGQIER